MNHATPVLDVATRTPPRRDTRASAPQCPAAPHGEFPLIEWLAARLRAADGLDHRHATQAARRIIEQAFRTIDCPEPSHTETPSCPATP